MTEAAQVPIEQVRDLPDYKKYSDPEWRIDNIYTIIDENGAEIPFKRNAAQLKYSQQRHSRDLLPKARQLGFSTYIEMAGLDCCVFRKNITMGIVDDTLEDAKKKLAKMRFAYERLPVDIRNGNPLIKKNTEALHWANGSKVSASTDYRGDTAQIMHISEYGKTSVDSPDRAKAIKTGSLRAIHANGWAVIESTAHGTAGEFHDMVKAAQDREREGRVLSALEFKLHFYGWWMKPEYQVPNNLVVLTQELREYFAKVGAILLTRYNVRLNANQMAWYAIQHADLGPDSVKEEFPTIIEELFFNSMLGAYFRKEMAKARADHRIGLEVPHDPTRPVNTIWDIGEDCTAIIFHQTDGLRHRVIDYYEEEGGSLQAAAGVIDRKKGERGFLYGKHIGPHDLDHRVWTQGAQSRKQTAKDLGINFEVVPRVEVKADSIEAARRILGLTWFDQVHASLLVDRLDNYRKRWNKLLQVFSADPVHDMASHGSDAFQQLAMFFDMLVPKVRDRGRPPPPPRSTSPWAS